MSVYASTRDSSIESPTTSAPVCLGFSLLNGMCEDPTGRIALTRAGRPLMNVADLARRARLDRHALQVIARANALLSLAGDSRRATLWPAAAAVRDQHLLRNTERGDSVPALPQASEGSEFVTGYRAKGFALGRRPLTLLRDRLQPAEPLQTLRSGNLARAYGLVTMRQRPGATNGVLFMTLDDKTGQVNAIPWPQLLETYWKEPLGAVLRVPSMVCGKATARCDT
nr:hypothetical protein [Burkholderia cepacia]